MAYAMKPVSLIRRSPLYGDEAALVPRTRSSHERAANAYELRNRDNRQPPRTELWVILPDFAHEIAVRLFDCAALPYTWRVALRDCHRRETASPPRKRFDYVVADR
jgi:hypothetical protein